MFISFVCAELLSAAVTLTPQESEYLKTHPVIKVHNEKSWAPFNFNENDTPKGLSIDFMNLVAQKTGLKVEYVAGPNWNDFLEMMKNGTLDVMLNIVKNDEREKFLAFTNPYQLVPHCIVTKVSDTREYKKYEDILDKTIAVEEGFYNHNYLSKNHQDTKLVLRKDILGVLQAVSYGEADLTIGILPIEAHTIRVNGLNNLKIVGVSSDKLFAPKELRMAVALGNDTLKGILQKGLDDITETEKSEIVKRWVTVDLKAQTDWILIGKIFGGFFLIISAIGFYTWRVKKIQKKLADSNLLMKTMLDALPNPIFHKNSKGVFTGFNTAYEKAFDVEARELLGKTVMELEYIPIEDRIKCNKEDTETIKESSNIVREQEMVFADGKARYALYSVQGFKNSDGKPGGLIGIFTDITAIKETEANLKKAMIELEAAKGEVECMHKRVKESIEFSSLIQHSIMPLSGSFRSYFSDYFVIWHPKDIVGGDIYFFEELNKGEDCLLIVADCTGHGVPGALVTMMVKATERQAIEKIKYENKPVDVSKLLGFFNENMKSLLKQDEEDDSISNVGFDSGIIYCNKKEGILKFAGAQTSLFYVEDGELKTIKGDKHSIGYKKSKTDFRFTEHTVKIKEGIPFYITTDGYIDQNGGEKGFPFGRKRFCDIIEKNHTESLADQQEIFLEELYAYQKDETRNDDITVIGFRF